MPQFRNEDDNTTEIVTQFSASMTCSNTQYNAYAGRIDLTLCGHTEKIILIGDECSYGLNGQAPRLSKAEHLS